MRIHVNLPNKLVEDIDTLAGKGKRSEYIAEAVAARARRDRQLKALDETRGVLKEEDYPYWSTPEKIAQWVHDLRAIPSSFERNYGKLPAGRKRTDRLAKSRPQRR